MKTLKNAGIIAMAGFTATLMGCTFDDYANPESRITSLTGEIFTGKKFYLGWGHADMRDPSNMHNEVKYDVKHTHDIFTKDIGGNYAGSQLVGNGSTPAITSAFQQIASQIGPEDMYLQYSSGHGFPQGLQYGGSYQEIASRVLALPAKEVIVFTMACHSGGLVDTFNSMRSQWQGRESEGRTLFVMSSSTVQQTSSTGPGHGGAGPYGSAGSAFGHSLWKALSGEADGFVDGVKDGFVDLEEIKEFTIAKTQRIGGHTPVVTGTYNGNLVMAQAVSPADPSLSHAGMGTSQWTEAEMRDAITAEDDMWMDHFIGGWLQ